MIFMGKYSDEMMRSIKVLEFNTLQLDWNVGKKTF